MRMAINTTPLMSVQEAASESHDSALMMTTSRSSSTPLGLRSRLVAGLNRPIGVSCLPHLSDVTGGKPKWLTTVKDVFNGEVDGNDGLKCLLVRLGISLP